jgi:cytochrome c oxidase subunit 3
MSTDNSAHASHVAHHFRDSEHQFDTSKTGIWLFMVTEILMFGGLFVGYAIFHRIYPEMFAEGAKQLDWKMGFINTLVLIFSSFTMALGLYYCQIKRRRPCL